MGDRPFPLTLRLIRLLPGSLYLNLIWRPDSLQVSVRGLSLCTLLA